MEPREHAGVWWLPNNPDNKVSGTLFFNDEEGILLRLIGSLEDISNVGLGFLQSFPTVLGLTTNGKSITLTECTSSGVNISVPGLVTQNYKGSLCLIGGHFEQPTDLVFGKLCVSLSHLADWVRTSGFTFKRYFNGRKVEVAYELPEELKAKTSDADITISFVGNTSGDGFEELSIRQSVWFEVETKNALDIYELFNHYINPLQNLLTLATTKANSILELKVFSNQVTVEINGKTHQTPIEVVFQQRHVSDSAHKLLIPDYMLFALQDVFDDFETILNNWFSVADELDSVCNLFFAMQYNPRLNMENEFLNAVQALESYHRRRMKNEVQPKSKHSERVESIVNRVNDADKEWLKGILTYSNEPRLEARLNELLQKMNGVLASVIDDDAKFAKKVKNTRNYLTHFDKRLERKAARGSELFWLIRKLSYLLQLCLLLEIGLPLDKCAELLHRNQSFIQMPGLEKMQS